MTPYEKRGLGCGNCDWERCSRMLREYIAANKAAPLDEYVIRDGAVKRAEEMTK